MAFSDSAIGLIFRLRADNSDAVKGLRETEKEADKLSGATGNLADSSDLLSGKLGSVASLASSAAAGIGIVAGAAISAGTALFNLANNASEAGSEIFDASQKTGLSAETLSALKLAADEAGSSLDQVSGGVTKFSRLIAEAAQGSDKARAKLVSLGLDPQTAINDLDGSLEAVFKRIAEAENPIVAVKLATDAFGKSGADLIPVIKSFDGDLQGLIARATELGVVFTDEAAAKADEFGDTLDDVKKQAAGVAYQFALEFMPQITSALKEVSDFLAENKDAVKIFGQTTAQVIDNTVYLFKKLSDASEVTFRALGLDMLSAREKVGLLLAAFSPLLAAIDAYREWSGETSKIGASAKAEGRVTPKAPADFLSGGGGGTSGKKDKQEDPTKNWNLTKVLEAMGKGTMSQESGGNQFARNGRTGAMGLFQVMPDNVRDWTKATFGREMSPEEFKKDTKAQIAIFNKYMGAYLQRGLELAKGDWDKAIRIAAVQWYGTSKKEGLGYDDSTIFQKGEPSRREYTQSVLRKTKKYLTGKDGDFSSEEAEKQQQIAEKLREQAVKNREAQDKQILEIAKRTAAEEKAGQEKLLASKFLSESVYRKNIEAIDQEFLITEKTILEERLKMAELSAEDRAKIEAEIAQVTSELKIKLTEEETANIKNANAELEKQKEIIEKIASMRAEVLQSERDLMDFRAEQERKVLANQAESAKSLRDRIDAELTLKNFDIEQENLKKQRRLDDLKAEKQAALARLTEKERELGAEQELLKQFANYELQITEETEARKKEIEDTYKALKLEQQFGEGFGGNILQSVFGSPEQMQTVADAWIFLGNQVGGVINSMIQGVGSMVESWVLLGSSGGASIRKFTAQVLASLAAQAAVQALFELAKGFAMLFINPAESTAHFTAAAIFGGIAGVAAIAGRAVAGDSFKQANSASNSNNAQIRNGGTGTSANNATIYESGINSPYGGIASARTSGGGEKVEITLKLDSNGVLQAVTDDINRNGKLRNVFLRLVEES